jgi:hypothetical protein
MKKKHGRKPSTNYDNKQRLPGMLAGDREVEIGDCLQVSPTI